MAKSKKPLEAAQGRYFAIPHALLDSDAWKRTSPTARALLLELCRQHTGSNNGALHLARAWVEARGWSRPATVRKLADELLQNRLIVQTRSGGLNNGAHQYALTWLPITNFVGLKITSREYAPGAYLLPPLPPPVRERKQKGRTPYVLDKPNSRTPSVLDDTLPRTPSVRETVVLGASPRTPSVHNEYNQSPPAFGSLLNRGWMFVGWRKQRRFRPRALDIGLNAPVGGQK